MASKTVEYGGHDYSFVCEIPDRLNCNVCTKVLRDPHLAVCCGQHFCESCLNKWFTRHGKESCPHCRAEGEGFHHVIHKGLRSEINQLRIRCSNHRGGCQWTGELGELKQHLESDSGCGYVSVHCPNKCEACFTILRKDIRNHLINKCKLRPYQCEFCSYKDTFAAIKGDPDLISLLTFFRPDNPYGGHQAKCPEAPLTCPNECGSKKIKRKDMKSHRSQCPQEPVECPFAEVGCKIKFKRYKLEEHITSNQQQHLMLVMKGYKEMKVELSKTKNELLEVKGLLTTATQLLRQGTEADKETVDSIITCSSRLKKIGDSVEVVMPKFSEYCRNGRVWYSPPFYYRGYKMCLAVYANGVGKGAGTHVSVTLTLLEGEHDSTAQHRSGLGGCSSRRHLLPKLPEGQLWFNVCQYQPLSQYSKVEKELSHKEKFCTLNYVVSKLVNDCLTFNILYYGECYLKVSVK